MNDLADSYIGLASLQLCFFFPRLLRVRYSHVYKVLRDESV